MSLLTIVNKEKRTKEERESFKRQVDEAKGLAGAVNRKRGTGKSARVGNEFEKEIQTACDVYFDHGIAFLQKFTPPTVFIPPKNGKAGFMLYHKKVGFDFIGGFADGTTIFIEVKTTKSGVIQVGQEASGIKEHQLEFFQKMQKFEKFIMFFLWKIRDADGIVFKFTLNQLLTAIGDKKSLSIMDCEMNGFERIMKIDYEGIEIYDFLGVLE